MSPISPEQWEELSKIIADNRARQEALEGRAEATIQLVQSPGELPLFSPEYQAELEGVLDAFRAEGVDLRVLCWRMDSPNAAGGYLSQFIIPIIQIGVPAFSGIVGAWLHAKFGRKVRVEFYANGAIKRVEAQTIEQVSSLIELARREAQPRPTKQGK